MNCFYHPDKPALGICNHCQRGLCTDCVAVIDDVLACKNRHEDDVHMQEQLTARNLFQSKRVGSTYMRNAVFYGSVGIVFAPLVCGSIDTSACRQSCSLCSVDSCCMPRPPITLKVENTNNGYMDLSPPHRGKIITSFP